MHRAEHSWNAGEAPGSGPAAGVHLSWIRRLWRALWPFWLFEDASRGDLYTRAAARRHNLSMRASLPRYLLRWLLVGAAAAAAIFAFDGMAQDVGHRLDFFALAAAGSGLLCAYAACALLVIGYAYLSLTHLEHESALR